MATKKAAPKKAAPKKKDTLVKIAEAIGEAAGHISVKKDQLANKASQAVDAIKDGMHTLVEKEKKVIKKLTGKGSKKTAPKKAAKPDAALLHKTLHKKTGAKKPAKKASPRKSAGRK